MDFVILALATFRISSLIADEDGPGGMLEGLRSAVGVARDESGQAYGLNNFATGLICQWCNSIWVGFAIVIAYMWFKDAVLYLCFPFSLSAATMIIARYTHG